ncbi:hypothetical protein [Taibaiella chishuiensis]|uniref:Uncharacterized protein n=1 Tax=Taibaiella chishuiensis TaxID=1434707 RepID=A0A2P8CY34_9BACT|nr:hypothetical protein [Taibaiella chishuiensis]PSK89891.1 hypothetical protein B0I18_110193 [Taibaiella chishuiensis]
MTKEAINKYLDELEHRLINEAEQITIGVNASWVNQFANEAAVYIFREDGVIVHVGETKSLNALMIKLVSSKSAADDMGMLLQEVVAKHLKLSYLLVDLGRKELEERILERIKTATKSYTKAGKQQAHKNAYERWTEEDDERLELLFCEGKSVRELMNIFARNEGAIESRIKKLELREKYDR